MKILRLVFPLILCTSLLTGCYDNKEIDETAYIIAIGIDRAETSEYKYTFQFSAPLAISGEGGGSAETSEGSDGTIPDSGNPGVRNVAVCAADFYQAKNMLNNFLSKNIDMSHLKLIVFSPEVDRDGYISHSQLFLHEREVRPHTCLAVAEHSAEEFLRSVNPELELNTAKYYELMSLRSNNVYAPVKMLRDFADNSAFTGRDCVLPIARVSEYSNSLNPENSNFKSAPSNARETNPPSSQTDMRGMAVFRSGEPVGEMDGSSALVYNLLTRGIKKCTISLRSLHKPDSSVSFRITVPQSAHFNIAENNGRYTVKVSSKLGIEYIGGGMPDGYRSYDELCEQARIELEQKFSEFLYSSSREYNADILDICRCLRRRFSDFESLRQADPARIYRSAEFDVKVSAV